MTPALASGLLLVLGAYLGIGALLALVFVCLALQRLDPAALGMPWAARLLIVPGAAALWPVLAWKWLRRQPPPVS